MTAPSPHRASPSAEANDEGLPRAMRLVCVSELSLELLSTGEVHINHRGRMTIAHEPALLVIDAFRRPRAVGEVIEALASRDNPGVERSIEYLFEEGILKEEGRAMLAPSARIGWDSSSLHVRMLRDLARTDAFIRAINETVEPNDVVLDIGTGTGVLAMAAARAGARRVFAVEASGIADVAAEMFQKNGLGDRIELFRGWSSRITLPEKATVLVSETLGNEALAEHIAETVHDANARLLTENAKRIPSQIRVWAIPTTLPSDLKNQHAFTTENVEAWGNHYGMDFRVLEEAAARRPFPLYLKPSQCKGWPSVASPVLLASVDLADPELTIEHRVTFEVERAGALDALMLYFDLTLSPKQSLDTFPEHPDEKHWEQPVWVLGRARQVTPGDRCVIHYGYRMGTDTIDVEVLGR